MNEGDAVRDEVADVDAVLVTLEEEVSEDVPEVLRVAEIELVRDMDGVSLWLGVDDGLGVTVDDTDGVPEELGETELVAAEEAVKDALLDIERDCDAVAEKLGETVLDIVSELDMLAVCD